jgi:cupin superfamily acireductone dioxygenase involved in methionine salvage
MMYSKKITAVLLAVGVVASTATIFNQINIKGAFAETVKQNVVYTKGDSSTASQDDGTGTVSGAEKEAYKEKSLDVLKNYFNISVEENENFKFNAAILNEKTLNEIKPKEQEAIQDMYDKKEISKEEYDKQMAYIEENHSGLQDRVAKLKHGMVQTGWVGDNKCYMIDLNENTKEVDFVLVSEGLPKESDVPLTISEDQLKNTAEDFIKQHKLGDIEKPKCILVKGHRLFYQEENDSTKKVEVGIDGFTGKVSSFSVKAYADLEYNTAISEK